MPPLPTPLPAVGQLFRHLDGGFYRYLTCVRSTDDCRPMYVYEPVWPSESDAPWCRNADEWPQRFTAVSEADLTQAMTTDRAVAQEAVQQARAARRALEHAQRPKN